MKPWHALFALTLSFLLRLLVIRTQTGDTKAAHFLSVRLGTQPTGPDGTWTRRDRLRAAASGLGVLLLALGVAVPLQLAADSASLPAPMHTPLSISAFVVLVLGVGGGVWGLNHLLQAALDPWQPQRPPSQGPSDDTGPE